MGNHSTSMAPPNAQARQPPAGSQEAYAGVRVQAMPGGGRVVNDEAAGAGGGRRRMSWGAPPPARPQTVVQKTKLVRNSCHVRKDTVSFKKADDNAGGKYQLSFRFDADVPCKVVVYLLATEFKDAEGHLSHQTLLPGEDDWVVGPHRFEAGANQVYSTAGVGFPGVDLDQAYRRLLIDNGGNSVKLPLLCFIVFRPEGGDVHCQVTGIGLEPKASSSEEPKVWTARVIKQKIETPDGIFVLQEIYGIAGTTAGASGAAGDNSTSEGDDDLTSGAECVVCLTNKRELAILPCRHMCVCRACAAECIQSQDSRCPICRNPAQALLKLTLDEDDRHHQPRDTAQPRT